MWNGYQIQSICLILAFFNSSCGSKDSKPIGGKLEIYGVESPHLGMTLGRGYDYFNRESVRGDCFEKVDQFEFNSYHDVENSIETYTTEHLISSHEDLLKELNFSTGLTYRNMFFESQPKFQLFESYKASQDSITWVHRIKVTTFDRTLRGMTIDDLSDSARSLLEGGDYEGFTLMCGTHFVRSIAYGGEFFQLNEIEICKKSKKSNIDFSLDSIISENKGNFDIKRELGVASSDNFIKKQTFQSGGGVSLSGVDLGEDNGKLIEWLESLKKTAAKPYSVELADWQTIYSEYRSPHENSERLSILNRIYSHIRHNLHLMRLTEHLIEQVSKSEIFIFPESLKLIGELRDQVASQQETLFSLGKKCFRNSMHCANPTEKLLQFSTPKSYVPRLVNIEESQLNNVYFYGSEQFYKFQTDSSSITLNLSCDFPCKVTIYDQDREFLVVSNKKNTRERNLGFSTYLDEAQDTFTDDLSADGMPINEREMGEGIVRHFFVHPGTIIFQVQSLNLGEQGTYSLKFSANQSPEKKPLHQILTTFGLLGAVIAVAAIPV